MSVLLILSFMSGCTQDSQPAKSSGEGKTVETNSGANVVLEGRPLERITEAGKRGDERVGKALENR